VKPRKRRLVLRVMVLAFLVQWPMWIIAVTLPPRAGVVAAWAAICADTALVLGAVYGVCYGIYRLARWALGS
jgi:hypothetical protein